MTTLANLATAASNLLSEHRENPEYDRAIVELFIDTAGLGLTSDDRVQVEADLRAGRIPTRPITVELTAQEARLLQDIMGKVRDNGHSYGRGATGRWELSRSVNAKLSRALGHGYLRGDDIKIVDKGCYGLVDITPSDPKTWEV